MKITTVLIIAFLGTATLALPPVPLEIKSENNIATARWNRKPVMEYMLQPSPFKPYARQLFTPSGINVVRDQVADHIHHHGLMFAVKVNDVNFWEEAKAPGKQVAGQWGPSGVGHGMMHPVEWTGPDKTVHLLETRRITFQESPDPAANLITWQAVFSTPPGKDSAKITGSHYHGLGMRFVKSMDASGPFIVAGNKEAEVVRGDEKLYTTTWCAYTGKVDDKPVTVALFDAKANPRPATFFTMSKGFAYMSATLKYHKEPLTIEKDKPVTLTYGIAVWDGAIPAEQIEKLYQAWLAK